MERIKTGIKGFDDLIEGGLPKGSSVLLSGTPGTGKTIFGLEFLFNGVKNNEKGMYVTFEEEITNLIEQAKQFGWDLQKLAKNKDITILSIPTSEINNNTVNEVITLAKKNKVDRLVIDSLSTLAINVPTVKKENADISRSGVKRFIYSFVNNLKKANNTTSLIIAHTNDEKSLSKDSVSEFIADGIIHVTFESMGGEFSRSLIVRKMRRTKNDEDVHPLEISNKGLVVHTLK